MSVLLYILGGLLGLAYGTAVAYINGRLTENYIRNNKDHENPLQRANGFSAARQFVNIGALVVLFLFYGVEAAAVICRFAGILLALIGAFYIFSFIIAKAERVLSTWGSLLAGILCFAAGLWMAVRPLTAIQYLQYVIAIVVLLHGIIDLQASFHLVRARARLWIYALVSSIVTLGLGTWILLSPMGATKALMILMGVVLIVDGITDLILIASLSRTVRHLKKEAEVSQQAAEAVETTGTIDGKPIE